MKRICVFCGSNPGNNPAHIVAARELGVLFAQRRITLVYGGGNVGLMGEISNAVMQAGGEAIGVIPHALASREAANTAITDLRVVDSMHDRKALMASLADGFIALPGGIGTLEEFAEIVTWAQLDIHHKPCGLLDNDGYYHNLIAFIEDAQKEGFILPEHRSLIIVEREPVRMIERLLAYHPARKLEEWLPT